MKKAFTLIELLIVVAIIAILAAIAVPNFLEAQTRSKVARIKSDMRTYATAIESYAVDHNRPPREAHAQAYIGTNNADVEFNQGTGANANLAGNISNVLSTPVSYITVARIKDPFQDKNLNTALDEIYYTYWDNRDRAENPVNFAQWGTAWYRATYEYYGSWRMTSVGPDRRYGHGFSTSGNLAYDATNGTISFGNIHRSQKFGDNSQPTPGLAYPPSSSVLLIAH